MITAREASTRMKEVQRSQRETQEAENRRREVEETPRQLDMIGEKILDAVEDGMSEAVLKVDWVLTDAAASRIRELGYRFHQYTNTRGEPHTLQVYWT